MAASSAAAADRRDALAENFVYGGRVLLEGIDGKVA
jgi:hypothetical protein